MIGVITSFVWIIAIICSYLEHALLDATFGNEAFLHGLQETVEHIDGLMDECEGEVCHLFVVHPADGFDIVFLYLFTAGILAHLLETWVLRIPLGQGAHAKVIFIVGEEFLEACLRHVGELYLSLAGCRCCLISLGNVLLAASCGLHHLVHSAVALGEISLGEVVGDVIDNLGDLINA